MDGGTCKEYRSSVKSRLFSVGGAQLCTALSGVAANTTINTVEAKSLVRTVLRHEHIRLSSRYCTLEQIDKPSQPFAKDYYSFSASCDYANTAATTSFGIYVVSPRTGDVFEFNRCEWFNFPELRRLQRNIMQRTKHSARDEARYREATGCTRRKVVAKPPFH